MQNASRIELQPVSQRVQVHVVSKMLSSFVQCLEISKSGFLKYYVLQKADVMKELIYSFKPTATIHLKPLRFF